MEYSIKEMSEKTGLSIPTLRFYDKEWLAADYKLHIKLLKKYSIILYFFIILLYNISKEWWHFYV